MADTAYLTSTDCCIISCGMSYPELIHLQDSGFLNPRRLLFTPPGLHALPDMLEQHLLRRLAQAHKRCPDHKIVVVYGKKCYVKLDDPLRRVNSILQEAGREISRLQGDYGCDMLASYADRQRICGGKQDKILWFTPRWLKHWQAIYRKYLGWDGADANASFPGFYDKIIVLDSLGLEKEYMTHHAEEVLELFDWTELEVEFHPISLHRFRALLADAISRSAPSQTHSIRTDRG